MCEIAVISDIHSNALALEAVLKDIQSRNIEMIVNLGDTLLGPLDPVSTAERLMPMKNVVNIMGNGDAMLLQDNASSASYNFTRPLLTQEMIEWIKGFKAQWVYENILFCHGSPDSNSRYLVEEITSVGMVNKTIDVLKFELEDIPQNYIVCGHSHIGKTVYISENMMVINPGSVGLPAYTDEEPLPHRVETLSPYAKYAIITTQDYLITKVEHVELFYDWNQASNLAKENSREDYAYPLKTGAALNSGNRMATQ